MFFITVLIISLVMLLNSLFLRMLNTVIRRLSGIGKLVLWVT